MRVAAIDIIATRESGILHKTPIWVKLIALGLTLGVVVSTWNPWVLSGVGAVWLLAGLVGRLPIKLLVSLSSYPLVFAVLFAVTTELGGEASLAIMLKGCATALGFVCIILSTPYHRLFAAIGRVLPSLVTDTLFMTYRTLFILAEELENLMLTVRLRGNFSLRKPITSLRNISSALANLILFSFDLAAQEYDILVIRGYDGTIRIGQTNKKEL